MKLESKKKEVGYKNQGEGGRNLGEKGMETGIERDGK